MEDGVKSGGQGEPVATPDRDLPSASEQQLPIRLTNLDDYEARYVNLIHVNSDRASFQLTFSQFLQPVLATPDDAERLVSQGYVPAKVIARLLFTPLMMEETISLMQHELDQYYAEQRQTAEGLERSDDDE